MGNCCQRCLTDRSLEETRSKGVSTESYEYSNRFDVLESEKVESPTWFQQFTPNVAEIRPQSQVYHHKVSLSVPVCTVGKDRPSTFTTLELIRRELNKVFPDIAVKEKDQNGDVALVNQWQERTKDATQKHRFTKQTNVTINAQKHRFTKQTNLTINAQKHRFTESGQITPSIETCIECMKKNPDDFSKQLIYSEHIGTLAEQESLSFLLCKSDAIACLLTALKTFPDKLELNLTVFSCLLKLASVSAANCSHIVEHDGVSVIKNTLRRFTDSTELLRLVLRTTKFISAAEELVATLSGCDLHCEIFQALYRHTADRDVVTETCYILGNLLFAEKTGQQLLRFGGLPTIISLVEKYSDDVIIMENVCKVLGCFANNDQTHLAVCQAGATQVIVKVLTSAISSVPVFESSLWALACLTVSESTCQDVVALGGVDTVLNILTEHPLCELVQLYGTRTLYNISTF
uniref:Armadillo repeat-containing domain-containing protein n=1 Tax=Biomphalaria glabrata TaxID=6526 RepID=A0A2C9LSG6_BIOGL